MASGSGGITLQDGNLKSTNTSAINTITIHGPSTTAGSWVGINAQSALNSSPVVDLAFATIRDGVQCVFGTQIYLTSSTVLNCQKMGIQGQRLHLTNTSISNTGAQGMLGSDITVTGGTISNTGTGNSGDIQDLPLFGSGIAATGTPLSVTGVTFTHNAREAIRFQVYAGVANPVTVQGNTITDAGYAGAPAIDINDRVDSALSFKNNTIRSSGTGAPGYPAAVLSWYQGAFDTDVAGNQGGGNALDLIVLDNLYVSTDFTWRTPTNAPADHPLGYAIGGGLNGRSGASMTFPAGSVVKSAGGGISIVAANIKAATGTTFTSVRDNSVGLAMCPSSIRTTGCGAPSAADWSGLSLRVDWAPANATLTNTAIRYTARALDVHDQPQYSSGPPGAVTLAGVNIAYAGSGVTVDNANLSYVGGSLSHIAPLETNGQMTSGIGVSGGMPTNDGSRAADVENLNISDVAMAAIDVWNGPVKVINNTIDQAARSGGSALKVSYSTVPVIKGNTVTNSGSGAKPDPAIAVYSSSIDPAASLSGNTGGGNSMDAIGFPNGGPTTSTASFSWVTPTNQAATHPLGFVGFLTVGAGTTLTVPANSIVKGTIGVEGILDASATGSTFHAGAGRWSGDPQLQLAAQRRHSDLWAVLLPRRRHLRAPGREGHLEGRHHAPWGGNG